MLTEKLNMPPLPNTSSTDELIRWRDASCRIVAESCAAKCDEVAGKPSSMWEEHGCWSHAAENCAEAIRSEFRKGD